MKKKRNPIDCRSRRGAMSVLCAVGIMALLFVGVLLVDVGWITLAKSELRAATDAAARGALTAFTEDASDACTTERIARAKQIGMDIFRRNSVGGQHFSLDSDEMEFGTRFDGTFVAGTDSPNAVRVTLNTEQKGGVPLLLADNVFGAENFAPHATSVTAFDPIDVIVLFDISRSMSYTTSRNKPPSGHSLHAAPHPSLSRFSAAQDSLESFLAAVKTRSPIVRIAFVTLGGGKYFKVVTPYDKILAKVETHFQYSGAAETSIMDRVIDIGSNTLPWGTSHYAGLEESYNLMLSESSPNVRRMIVMLSDGMQTGIEKRNPLVVIDDIADAGIPVHTIYFAGSPKGIKVMRKYSELTGGQALTADSHDELDAAFAVIANLFHVKIVE